MRLVSFLKKSIFWVLYVLILLELSLHAASFFVKGKYSEIHVSGKSLEKVILCLGDSCTYGIGASSRKGSFPSFLQYLLDQDYPGEFIVLNRSQPGASSMDCVNVFKAFFVDDKPDVVVWCAGANDHWNYELYPEELKQRLNMRQRSVCEIKNLIYQSRVVRFAIQFYYKYFFVDPVKDGFEARRARRDEWTRMKNERLQASQHRSESLAQFHVELADILFIRSIKTMMSLCEENKIVFILRKYLDGSPDFVSAYPAAREEFDPVDISGEIKELEKEGLNFFSPDDFHPNDLGYYNLALAIYNRLIDEGVISEQVKRKKVPVREIPSRIVEELLK